MRLAVLAPAEEADRREDDVQVDHSLGVRIACEDQVSGASERPRRGQQPAGQFGPGHFAQEAGGTGSIGAQERRQGVQTGLLLRTAAVLPAAATAPDGPRAVQRERDSHVSLPPLGTAS